MKIERAWLRIIVGVIVGGIAGFALLWAGYVFYASWMYDMLLVAIVASLAGPIIATVLVYMLTPKEKLDGEMRCRKCGYILKGLTEPRCSECGERI